MSQPANHTEVAGADVIATSTPSQTNVFASILRFLHLVRMRRGVMIGWMLVCLVIGAIFYAVAPRLYDSTAQIFVIRNAGGDARDEQSDSITDILKTLFWRKGPLLGSRQEYGQPDGSVRGAAEPAP